MITCDIDSCSKRFFTKSMDYDYYTLIQNGHSVMMEVDYYHHLIYKHEWKWCGLCEKPVGNIKQHNIDVHDSPRPYECIAPVCCANFTTVTGRNKHLVRKHTWVRCPRCGPMVSPYPQKRYLYTHLKEDHLPEYT